MTLFENLCSRMVQPITALLLSACLMLSNSVSAQEDKIKVLMLTDMGEMEIELYAAQAPITVENFLRYVDAEVFDGGEFYRTVTYDNDNGSPKIEVIQGGLNEEESPFPPIAHESTQMTGILHEDGVLSMARGGVGTASSEFFICLGDQPGLDFGKPRNEDNQGFAAFGKVIRGIDIARRINQSGGDEVGGEGYTAGQILLNPIKIVSVRRL